MCSFLSTSGKHLVLLGISGVDNVSTLFVNDSAGNVVLKVCVYLPSFGSLTDSNRFVTIVTRSVRLAFWWLSETTSRAQMRL